MIPIGTNGQFALIPQEEGKFDISAHGKRAGVLYVRTNQTPLNAAYHGHIEYEIARSYRGMGLARQACEAIKPVLAARGIASLHITCATTNTASKKTIEKLGCKFIGEITLPTGETRLRFLWKIQPATLNS